MGDVRAHRRIDPRRALARVGIAFVLGCAAYGLTAGRLAGLAPGLVGWDVASLTLLVLQWTIVVQADAAMTRSRAGAEDPGRTLVYVIVVLSSTASLLAATLAVREARTLPLDLARLVAGLCLLTVLLAWSTTHTAFTFRYARLYYREDHEGVGGIELPGKAGPPTYFDFAYFAFTIGMCFQVSDMCITGRQIRKAALLHALISFAYNSVILAFVLQLVFGMAGTGPG
jgi:uncharacterized membrane protein